MVYPNPTTGIINVLSGIEINNWSLISLAGNIVLNGAATSTTTSIDVNSLEAGIYILNCNLENGKRAYKRIVVD